MIFSSPRKFNFTVLSSCLVLALTGLVALVMYAASVYFDIKIDALSQKTRDLKESNQELLIRLDRIRSYKNIASATAKIKGLHVPTEVLDIPTAGDNFYHHTEKAPGRVIPAVTYGY
jgi:hypothetical protein